MKIHQLFLEQAYKTPGRWAVQDERERWTYETLAGEVHKRTEQLIDAGVTEGNIIALLQENSRLWLRDLLAVSACGAIALPLHAESTQQELARLFKTVQPDWILRLPAERDEASYRSDQPELVALGKRTMRQAFPMRTVGQLNELLLIGLTSGSTGAPKAYVKSHSSWTRIMDDWRYAFDLSLQERVVAPLSLSYSAQLFPLVHALCTGGEAVTLASFSPRVLLYARGTSLHITPAALSSLCNYIESGKGDASSLPERIISVGNKLSQVLRARVSRLNPNTRIYEYYGSSEMGCVSVLKPETASRFPDSVGEPFPGVEITFFQEEAHGIPGDSMPCGKLYVRSPQSFEGYMGEASLTASGFKGEWVTSHDLGYWTGEKMVRLIGRDRDIVKSGGSLVSTAELEAVLCQMPEVVDAAVVALPDEKRGEIIGACLVLKEQGQLSSVRKRCTVELPPYKRPRSFIAVEELPKTRNGKPDKEKLRQQLLQDKETP
ncbi:class I adenylate-forming enzyme family protein [Paenibacillus senegalensis]|uniref:class I adenylate-forming enzyme family protein n=1 Tax=Paenibacillus senegalensis TaxID=1465766 RepID=UPI00028818CA|nr:class I adenylate-forming enzyme family protein [Paenibacillus senegalensis]